MNQAIYHINMQHSNVHYRGNPFYQGFDRIPP